MNPLEFIGQPLTNIYFNVVIDAVMGLGKWSQVSGLGIQFKPPGGETTNPGGYGTQTVNYMSNITYPQVTLVRPVGPGTSDVLQWLQSYATDLQKTNVAIFCIDPVGTWIYQWTLSGVVPVSWAMDPFDAGNAKVMTEKLVISHEGFASGMEIPGLGGLIAGIGGAIGGALSGSLSASVSLP